MKEGDALKQINAQIVRLETQTLKDLLEREFLSISDGNELVRRALHLGLDEPEQMLLVHGRRVVDVGVDLSDVCSIAARPSVSKSRGYRPLFCKRTYCRSLGEGPF